MHRVEKTFHPTGHVTCFFVFFSYLSFTTIGRFWKQRFLTLHPLCFLFLAPILCLHPQGWAMNRQVFTQILIMAVLYDGRSFVSFTLVNSSPCEQSQEAQMSTADKPLNRPPHPPVTVKCVSPLPWSQLARMSLRNQKTFLRRSSTLWGFFRWDLCF